ncbi:MAG: hypothetical protein M1831_004859 [Alyxoria varia]|nr:MAG: hypothetical protein M1831_004859 [Alyxoria varia]
MSRHRSSVTSTSRPSGAPSNREHGTDLTSQPLELDAAEAIWKLTEAQETSPECNGLAKDTLFIKNLRFLDLDLLPDWPEITVESFKSRRNARLHQKSRLACAEWVLYRLFEKWDPHECQQKFKPFFPALEPLQSIKLRSALFQALNTLKHGGNLGRECVLRKSLLDDCQGDRFEELLYSFSTAVLRRVSIRSRENAILTVGERLATTDVLLNGDINLLDPLSLVYKKKLGHFLKRSDRRHKRVKELEQLVKEQHSNRTSSTLDALERLLVAHEALVDAGVESDEAMRKQILDNVVCDPDWLDLILNGNSHVNRDPLMEDDYRNVWKITQRGKHPRYKNTRQSLMTDLEGRVEQQQQRLFRWRRLQGEVSSRNEQFIVPTPKKTPQRSPSKSQRPTSLKACHRKAASANVLSTPNPRSAALNNLSRLDVGINAETPSRLTQNVSECDLSTPQLSEKQKKSGVATDLKVRPRSLSPRKVDQTVLSPTHSVHPHCGGHEVSESQSEPSKDEKTAPREASSQINVLEQEAGASQTSSSRDASHGEFEESPCFDSPRISKQCEGRDSTRLDTLSSRTRQTLNPRPCEAHNGPSSSDMTTFAHPSPSPATAKDALATAPLSLAQRTRASVLLMSTSKPDNGNVNDAIIGSSSTTSARLGNKNKSSMRKKSKKLSRSFPVNPFENENGARLTSYDSERAGSQSPTKTPVMKDLDVIKVERNEEVAPVEEEAIQAQGLTLDNPFITRSRVRRSQPSSPVG